jgi:serine/threonine-protein kinase RIM15
MDTDPSQLAPPAVTSLRAHTAGVMERSLSQHQREKDREDLKEAAEQTLNVIVDLNLDGSIRWVSPSWVDVMGTDAAQAEGTPISHIVASEPTTIFTDVVESMKEDDSGSKFIRFSVKAGPESKLLSPEGGAPETEHPEAHEQEEDILQVVDLEAQGIMVHDTGGESHVGHSRELIHKHKLTFES